MVKGLSESYGANREGLRRSEILPVAESTVNRFAQQTDVCSTQDDTLRQAQDDRLRKGNYEFNIFCSNKDLDGSLLQGIAFDEWVNYNAHTKIWYSSSNNILPVLQREIKNESSIIT